MSKSTRSIVLAVASAVYALLALTLCIGGAWLLARGGSAHYLVAGLGLLLCDWWQLLPRNDIWFLVGAWLLVPAVHRRLNPDRSGTVAPWGALGASVLVAAYARTLGVAAQERHDT